MQVTVWNEFVQERKDGRARGHYPQGIHAALAEHFAAQSGLSVRTATLDEPGHGLSEAALAATDVLFWFGHVAHDRVDDAVAQRVKDEVLAGMGLVVLHSGHASKLFKALMGTHCSLRWREADEKEIVWTAAPDHPIARGVPDRIVLDQHEMYGEPFDIPDPDQVVFMSWFQGGNVLRSGCTFTRGGRIFYFSPGHESYPVYRHPGILKVLVNAARWAGEPAAQRRADGVGRSHRGKSVREIEPAQPLSNAKQGPA